MADHLDVLSKVQPAPSIHDEMYDDSRTPHECAAFVHVLAKNMHQRMAAVESQMKELSAQLKYQYAEGKQEKKAKGK